MARASERTRRTIRLLAAALLAGAAPIPAFTAPALSQTDSVTIVADPRYDVGGFARRLLGNDYRDLWTMPIRVPVLHLADVGGGLRAVDVGGGRQTLSLQLVDPEGREYRFRSVGKWPERASSGDFAGALAGWILQDQVSSTVPAAPVPASRLTLAAGFGHPRPVLYVMADDPALGEYRAEFAGMLGTLEEYPDEWTDGTPGFGGFTEIDSTEDILELVDTDPRHRMDARTYLGARFVDLILGDWDRHEDQWRWARTDSAGVYLWKPIARDRDFAFAEYDGVLMGLMRRFLLPNAVRFSSGYRDLHGLLLNSSNLDRRILAPLDRAAWDSIAAAVQAGITDSEIEAAVASMPAGFVAARGDSLIARLRARRDSLAPAAAEFYAILARFPEVRGTDGPERAIVTRQADGSVTVSIDTGAGLPFFERSFVPGETSEVHLYLAGGDDTAVVRGSSSGQPVRVRIIGGPGNDVLADSSSVATRGRWTTLHDAEGQNVLFGGPRTGIDRRPYEPPTAEDDGLAPTRAREPGRTLGFSPILDYSTTRGPIVGVRLESTRYAFRRDPFATRLRIGAHFSTRWRDGGVTADAIVQTPMQSLFLEAAGIATRIDAMRFYGLGNETERQLASSFYVVRRNLLEGMAGIGLRIQDMGTWRTGVSAFATEPWLVAFGPLDATRPRGWDRFSALGFRSDLELEIASDSSRIRYGLDAGASAYPFVSDDGSGYGSVRGEASARADLGAEGATALAVRVGGEQVWGDYPFFAAAFLGGRESLRGLPRWRHAGDAVVYAGAEASAYLFRLPILLNWRVSPFAFFDVGRVFLEDEVSDRWHSAPGFGLALSALDARARISYALGPEGRLYVELGAPF